MNIDPASYTSAPFFKMMAEKGMTLLTHTGDEKTIKVYDDHQKYGNPMRLKQALTLGVTVVMQHSGRVTGKFDEDYNLDCFKTTESKKNQNFELFKKMMQMDFKNKLFGEISALTVPPSQNILIEILEDKKLHGRMVNGSDYPIPAVNISRPTEVSSIIYGKYITKKDMKALNMIYSYNPLLFDFVVKRTIAKDITARKREPLIPESMFIDLIPPLPPKERGNTCHERDTNQSK